MTAPSPRNYNNVTSRGSLTSPVAPGDVILLTSGFTNYPPVPFAITVERNTNTEELCLVTAVNGAALTVTRGYDGTAAQTHLAGAFVEHTAIAKDFREANQHTTAIEGVHGTTGALVGTEGSQVLFDKSFVSPVNEADALLGDAVVAYVPSGAEARNLFRGMNPNGDDVARIDSTGKAFVAGVETTGAVNAGSVTASGTVAANKATAVAAPTAANELVRKDYADALGTASNTASTIMRRSAANGVAVSQVSGLVTASITANDHAANKGYADALGTAAATVSTIVRRDASADTTVNQLNVNAAAPTAVSHATRKDYVDARFKTGNVAGTASDASSQIVITHGFGSAPSQVMIQSRNVTGLPAVYHVVAISATTFTVRCYYNNALSPSVAQSFGWVAFA